MGGAQAPKPLISTLTTVSTQMWDLNKTENGPSSSDSGVWNFGQTSATAERWKTPGDHLAEADLQCGIGGSKWVSILPSGKTTAPLGRAIYSVPVRVERPVEHIPLPCSAGKNRLEGTSESGTWWEGRAGGLARRKSTWGKNLGPTLPTLGHRASFLGSKLWISC